jgi:hypothetical protein
VSSVKELGTGPSLPLHYQFAFYTGQVVRAMKERCSKNEIRFSVLCVALQGFGAPF